MCRISPERQETQFRNDKISYVQKFFSFESALLIWFISLCKVFYDRRLFKRSENARVTLSIFALVEKQLDLLEPADGNSCNYSWLEVRISKLLRLNNSIFVTDSLRCGIIIWIGLRCRLFEAWLCISSAQMSLNDSVADVFNSWKVSEAR